MARRTEANCRICKSFLHTTKQHKRKEAEKRLVLERMKQIPDDAVLCNI